MEPAMSTEPKKPLIVISYARADEPEHPAQGEVKWLSWVTGYLRTAIKHGAVDLWLGRLMPAGPTGRGRSSRSFAPATSSSCGFHATRSRLVLTNSKHQAPVGIGKVEAATKSLVEQSIKQ